MRLPWGCVGVTNLHLMSPKGWDAIFNPRDYKSISPHLHSNVVGPWLKVDDALNLKGVKGGGKYVVFALITDWAKRIKNVKEDVKVDGNGMLKNKGDYLFKIPTAKGLKNKEKGMIWDYAVYQPSTKRWVGANLSAGAAARERVPQKFYTRTTKQLEKGFEYPKGVWHKAVVYFAWKCGGK